MGGTAVVPAFPGRALDGARGRSAPFVERLQRLTLRFLRKEHGMNMKRLVLIVLIGALIAATPACMTFNHKVGSGGTSMYEDDEAAWFILWGLVPLSMPDSQAMAANSTNYTVTTQYKLLDVIISFFTGVVTIHKQTVTVKR